MKSMGILVITMRRLMERQALQAEIVYRRMRVRFLKHSSERTGIQRVV
jgi:hypothetical protein